jgi:outer membrane assembly lipoprotein YfiO
MRFKKRVVLLSVLLLFSWGCAQKSAKLQKSVAPPDKTLFETGSEYLKKSQYIRARLAFQTLINTYPDSEMAAESYFAIGDSFYEEGGTENLLQAEDQYNNFIVFFPAHPKGPDAQMKIISANMKMMRAPDRDQQYSYKAERAIKKMLEQYPDSDYAPIAKRWLADVQDVIARGDLMVGDFYSERDNLTGAQLRYQEVVDKYPEFAAMDEVYFRMGNVWERVKNVDEAAKYYAKILEGYPFSKRSEEAKQRMVLLNKPVPPVDTQLAALNQSRLKPDEGFSPLKPFIDFGKALGFVGSPDRYEQAVATMQAEQTRTAEAELSKQAEAGKGSDGIQIETILRKSADGKVEETTVIGSGSGDGSQNEEEKKKDNSKPKKRNPKRPS